MTVRSQLASEELRCSRIRGTRVFDPFFDGFEEIEMNLTAPIVGNRELAAQTEKNKI